MGWVMLALIGSAALAAVALLRIDRAVLWLVGCALMLGATGYAVQGHPTIPGAAPIVQPADPGDSAAMTELRDRMLGRYTGDAAYVTAADAMMRAGEPRAAVQATLGGIGHIPESVLLWTELGMTLAAHDDDQVSPPALFAFQQAVRLSPRHPAPPLFLGLAYLRGGRFDDARPWLARALALTPADAPYRPDIAVRLMLLDQFLAMRSAAR